MFTEYPPEGAEGAEKRGPESLLFFQEGTWEDTHTQKASFQESRGTMRENKKGHLKSA